MGANEKAMAAYHGNQDTPTTEQVREDFATRMAPHCDGSRRSKFDRWLETVRTEAKAEALTEYADTLGYRISGATLKYGQCHIEAHDIIRELRTRATQLKDTP